MKYVNTKAQRVDKNLRKYSEWKDQDSPQFSEDILVWDSEFILRKTYLKNMIGRDFISYVWHLMIKNMFTYNKDSFLVNARLDRNVVKRGYVLYLSF